ncbi:MAG: type I glyceraldehyde-3-phosphate dehydrogenase [Chloroflexi bacterium]|nr:type I glyceraldehyde-3-phosphate dehydrogenase [Chloroflexota bacterium]|tara:strand:- start:832 stop:1839 length:1008 start_codon:yes stop_codon:yes gene_type:complete
MKKIKVGINGFGRIGRQLTKLIVENNDLDLVAINDLSDSKTSSHLFEFDSSYGQYQGKVNFNEKEIIIKDKVINKISEKDPSKINWSDFGVEIVIESTGIFTKKSDAIKHLNGSVKKVIISAPATNEDITIVMGVNDHIYDPEKHNVVSNASCTTNCVAPMIKVLNDEFGISDALMSTIHSFTNDQSVLDQPHSDLRRARTASANIIPTTTGAAKAVEIVIPEMKGKIDGMAYRVPTASVSVTDLTLSLTKKTDVNGLNSVLKDSSNSNMKNIIQFSTLPLVSQDFKGNPHSVIIDSLSTIQTDNGLFKLVGWYDNEWGYANRTFDLVMLISSKL